MIETIFQVANVGWRFSWIRDTSAVAQLSEIEIAIAQPLKHRQECLCYKGRARCFESWMTVLHQTTKLCHGIDSCFTATPSGHKWAVTPKLAMIAGRQLSIGALSV